MKRDPAVLFEWMMRLAEAHPGLPVVVLAPCEGEAHIGIMNFYPTDEDWYKEPIPVEEVKLDRLEPAED